MATFVGGGDFLAHNGGWWLLLQELHLDVQVREMCGVGLREWCELSWFELDDVRIFKATGGF